MALIYFLFHIIYTQNTCIKYHHENHSVPELYNGVKSDLFPEGFTYRAADVWDARVTDLDKSLIEDVMMQMYPSLTIKLGDSMMALGNQRGGGEMLTGMANVASGYSIVTREAERVAQLKVYERRKDVVRFVDEVILPRFDDVCGVESNTKYVFPVVSVPASSSRASFEVIVKPQRHDVVTKAGDILLTRWQIPLCGGRCIKFGMSLGITVSQKVFLDFSDVKYGSQYRFMGLTRTGEPYDVFLSRSAAISADMFCVHQDILDWYDSSDWVCLTVPQDESIRRTQDVVTMAGLEASAASRRIQKARAKWSAPLCT